MLQVFCISLFRVDPANQLTNCVCVCPCVCVCVCARACLWLRQVFPNEMPVFLREHDSGAYRVSSYFFGRTLVSRRTG